MISTLIDQIREHLDYNKKSGEFKWKKSSQGRKLKVGTVTRTKDGYAYVRITIFGKTYMASHLAMAIVEGRFPSENKVMDHRNRNGLNHAWENLREITPSNNNFNRRDMPSEIGEKFIHACRNGNFRVRPHGKSEGTFKDISEAIAARNSHEECCVICLHTARGDFL